jgi:hypothetical protein
MLWPQQQAEIAAFGTRLITGTFSLRTSNGFESILVSSQLRKS